MKYAYAITPLKRAILNQFSTNKIIEKYRDEVFCDFSQFNSPSASIECIIVKKNPLNRTLFSKCFPLCSNIILTDGGANNFYDTQFRSSQKVRAIVGNLQSIRPQVLNYYKDRGTQIQKIDNLETNDFDKALEFAVNKNWMQLFCFGAFGGRMDKSLSCMHLSAKFSKICPDTQIVMLGKSNIMYQLKKNINYRIKISQKDFNKDGCGLITFGKVDYVETEGFKYNLGKEHSYHGMQWGEFISTSNTIENENLQCKIRSSDEVFFVARYSPEITQ